MALDWDSAIQMPAKVNNNTDSIQTPQDAKRGMLDRIFDALSVGNYTVMGGIQNVIDDDPNTGFMSGVGEGLMASNPFGKGYEEGETIFSDVLDTAGWKPETTAGKVARGVVGFAGDVLLDPLTYVNPFSAGAKIVKGTGAITKGLEGAKVINTLSPKQARTVVDSFYKKRGIDPATVDVKDYLNEIEELQKSFNEKVLKVKTGGENLQVGGANLPFANKIKIGDKTLDTFTKTLVDADKLRAIGDKTIAPYYNELASKLRNTKALQKFNKYADLETLAQKSPTGASAIFKLENLIKGFDKTNIDRDLDAMKNANFINELSDDEKKFIVDFIESGDWKAVKRMQSTISKIRSQGIQTASKMTNQANTKSSLEDELNGLQDKLNELVSDIKQPKKKRPRVDSFGSEFYFDRLLKYQPSVKLEVAEVSPDTVFNEMLDRGEFDDQFLDLAERKYSGNVKQIIPEDLKQKRTEIQAKAKELINKYGKNVPKEVNDSVMEEFNNIQKQIADSQQSMTREKLLELGKNDEEIRNVLKIDFDEPRKLTTEFNAVGFTNESKKAVVDELNKTIFGKDRKVPVVKYDIDDTQLENIMKAIETNDVKTAHKLLYESVLQHNWDGVTFKTMYDRTNADFDYAKYGLDSTAQIRTTPNIKGAEYYDVREIPELIARYESGEKKFEGLLKRVAIELNLVSDRKEWLNNLKGVKSAFWKDYGNQLYLKKKELALTTGARDMRLDKANRDVERDALKAMQDESRNPDMYDLPHQQAIKTDQYFDYREMDPDAEIGDISSLMNNISERAEDISDYEYQHMYDDIRFRMQESIGKNIEQMSVTELETFRNIQKTENDIFGVKGAMSDKIFKKGTADENAVDELIYFMKSKGGDTRYNTTPKAGEVQRTINKYDSILGKLKDGGSQLNVDMAMQRKSLQNGIDDLWTKQVKNENRVQALLKQLDNKTSPERYNSILDELRRLSLEGKEIKQQTKDFNIKMMETITHRSEITKMMQDADNELDKLIKAQASLQDTPDSLYALKGDYSLQEKIDEAIETKTMLKNKLEQFDAVAKVRSKLEAKIPVTQIERHNYNKLTPAEQQKIAGDFKKWQENKFAKDMSTKSTKVITELRDKATNPAIKEQYDMYLKRRTAELRKVELSEAEKAKMIENLNTRKAEIEKQLSEFSSIDANKTAKYYLSNQYIKDELATSFGKNIAEIDRLMDMRKNTKLMDMTKFVTDYFNKWGEEEIKLGKLTEEQFAVFKDQYVPHMATDEGLKYFFDQITREHNGKYNPKTAGVGTFKSFDQHRTFKTIEKVNEHFKSLGLDKAFETDLADIFQARAIGHNELLFGDEMTDAIMGIFSKKYTADTAMEGYSPTVTYKEIRKKLYDKHMAMGGNPEDFKISDDVLRNMGINPILFSPNMPYIKLTEDQVKKIAQETSFTRLNGSGSSGVEVFNLKDELHPRLNKQSRIQKAMLSSELLNTYDKFLYMYKMWNSAINPGFHVQNSVSNAFQSFMSQGKAILEPEGYKRAYDIYNKKNIHKTIDYKGQKITYGQIRTLADKYGILDNTFFNEDIAISADAQGYLAKKGLNPKYDPTDVNNFVPYRKGQQLGSAIEGNQKLVLFIQNLEDGMSVEDAVKNTNKFLFDYSDLTEFEKETMKRVVPFYTYMRKNIPLQLEQMIANPVLYMNVAKAEEEIENMSGDNEVKDSDRNEWRQDYVQLPFQIGGENIGLNPQLPFQQLDRLAPNKILGQMTPAIKAPFEVLTGKYAYTGVPIENGVDYLASQTTPTKLINQQSDKEGIDKNLYIASQLSGLPTATIKKEEEWQK